MRSLHRLAAVDDHGVPDDEGGRWRVPVRGGVVTNDGQLTIAMAEEGLGLAYAFEPVK